MAVSENVVDPAARDKYLLEVTTGPSYDASTHQQVSVNGREATRVDSDIVTAWIKVRIKDYNGLPRGSPTSSSYFEHKLHTSDRYSIGYSFVPKRDIPGTDLIMGFDYDHSIRHQLPPGFKYALKIATSWLDPGLYADPYSDEPYLYGPALSSFFAFRIGERIETTTADEQLANLEKEADGVVEEGAEGSGLSIREELGLPSGWKKRRKHYLDPQALEKFTFEKGRLYHADFFNQYLDFANFSLRLPGFSISVARYIDEKTHHLRFVLKNRKTEEVLFVVFMKLLYGRELEEKLESDKSVKAPESPPGNGDSSKAESRALDVENKTAPAEAPISSQSSDLTRAELTHGNEEDQSITATATATANSAVSSLANSIYSVYAGLGFANPSSESESEGSSRVASPQPSSRSMEAQIDDMDDSAIENFLQNRHGSTS